MHSLAEHLEQVRERIADAARAAGREPDSVALLAVSKGHPSGAMRELYAAGQGRFGESYLQEALEKQAALADLDIDWHFVGPLQSNKTRPVAGRFSWVHGVDRLKIAQRLSDQRPDSMPPLNICLQVNLDVEAGKSGVDPGQAPALAEPLMALPRLKLRGLMAIPAPRNDYNVQRRTFARLQATLEDLRQRYPEQPLDTLSMGMSGDLEAAVAEGANLVRVGTSLFGERRAES